MTRCVRITVLMNTFILSWFIYIYVVNTIIFFYSSRISFPWYNIFIIRNRSHKVWTYYNVNHSMFRIIITVFFLYFHFFRFCVRLIAIWPYDFYLYIVMYIWHVKLLPNEEEMKKKKNKNVKIYNYHERD